MAIEDIQGGAATQVAQNAGDASYVGLSPDQAQLSRDMIEDSIARGPNGLRPQPAPQGQPIPTGLEGGLPMEEEPPMDDFMPPFEDPARPAENTSESNSENPFATDPNEPRVIRRVKVSEDDIVTVRVPQSFDGEDIRNFLIDKGHPGVKPAGSTMERFVYGFRKDGNIFTNMADYATSMYPEFGGELYYDPTDGSVEWISSAEKFGEDFDAMTPDQRRKRIQEVRQQKLNEDMPHIRGDYLGTAGTVGTVAKAVLDPVGILPVGRAAQGAMTTTKLAGRMAGAGAAWGGAYGVSEQLAQEGAPTSLEEMGQTVKRSAIPVATGAALGPVIGVPLTRGIERATGQHIGRIIKTNPEKAGQMGKDHIFPEIWALQADGLDATTAMDVVMRKHKLSRHDMWRMKEQLRREQYGSHKEFLKHQKIPLPGVKVPAVRKAEKWTIAKDPQEAAQMLGNAKGLNYGDPILQGRGMEQVDNFLRPIIGSIKDISERVGRRVLDMEGNILRKSHYYHEGTKPFHRGIKRIKKNLSKQDAEEFDLALLNNRREDARRIWALAGGERKIFDTAMKRIDEMTDELIASGGKVERLPGYFPRHVKDHKGLEKFVESRPKLQGLRNALSKARKRVNNRALTDKEVSEVTNDWLMGIKRGKKKNITSMKKRRIREVNAELKQFYHDPATSLEFHMREIVSKTERNKLFGKGGAKMNKDGVEDLDTSIGDMIAAEGITGDAAVKLKSLLTSRFTGGEEAGTSFLGAMRSATGGLTLGNPVSAVRQLGDIPSLMAQEGPINVAIGLFTRNHPDLNPDIAGYMLEMAQELDVKGIGPLFRKASDALYTYGQFKRMDRYTKGTFMRAALRNAQKSMDSPKKRQKFIRENANVYMPDELTQLMDDLTNRRMTDLVKAHVNARIMNIQPISRSHMPKVYLDNPNGRIWYQFRTWGLNQIEFVRRGILRDMRTGDKAKRMKAAGAMTLLLAATGGMNHGITQLQRAMTFRIMDDPQDMPDDMLWAALGNFGLFDRYGIEKALEQEDPEKWIASYTPPAISIMFGMAAKIVAAFTNDEPLDEGMKEIMKSWGLGRVLNFWLGDGAREYNEKELKKRTQEYNKQLGINQSR